MRAEVTSATYGISIRRQTSNFNATDPTQALREHHVGKVDRDIWERHERNFLKGSVPTRLDE